MSGGKGGSEEGREGRKEILLKFVLEKRKLDLFILYRCGQHVEGGAPAQRTQEQMKERTKYEVKQ